MYFEPIDNNELIEFHQKIRVNNRMLFEDITNDLFFIENINSLKRFFPLFYCDNIESSKDSVILGDNKCVIDKYDTDTIFNFVSDDYFNTINDLSVFCVRNENNFMIVLYSKYNLSPVANVPIEFFVSDENIINVPIVSFGNLNDLVESNNIDGLNDSLFDLVTNVNGIVDFTTNYSVDSYYYLRIHYKDSVCVVKLE